MSAPELHLYGLLHVAGERRTHANLSDTTADPIDVYLRCAVTCGRSVAAQGYPFILLTNCEDHLRARMQALGLGGIELRHFEPELELPPEIPFYSAHFKLDILRAFATGELGASVGLIDIDTVLQRRLPIEPAAEGGLLVYDISAQVFPAYGREAVQGDMERLAAAAGAALPVDPRWYGGEFILGVPEAFVPLAEQLQRLWPHYQRDFASFHHNGDEMVVSTAINMLVAAGLPVVECGARRAVSRWWSARTLQPQVPFGEAAESSLLHLPADKPFLAELSTAPFASGFLQRYQGHVARKLPARRLASLADRLRGRRRMYAPRLG